MTLILRVEHDMKDATNEVKKRVLFATLRTDIPGLERIDSVGEIPDDSPLSKEVEYIVTTLLSAKQEELKKKHKDYKKKVKTK